jgi:hypothetical protein
VKRYLGALACDLSQPFQCLKFGVVAQTGSSHRISEDHDVAVVGRAINGERNSILPPMSVGIVGPVPIRSGTPVWRGVQIAFRDRRAVDQFCNQRQTSNRGWTVSTRKTSRKVGSGATAQYCGKTASACETAVLQLKVIWQANLPSADPLRFVFVFFDCPAGKGIRLPLERSGDAVHRQPESKPGDSLRSRLPVWQRGKVYYRLILDVGGRCGNTLR